MGYPGCVRGLGKVRAGTKVETMKAEAHRLMCSLTCSVAQAQLVFLQPRAICVRDGAALSGQSPSSSIKTIKKSLTDLFTD